MTKGKLISLSIAVLGVVATVAAALTADSSVFHLAPEWAVFIGALGAGAYALVRSLQKIQAGATWKSVLATTEAWGAALAILAPIVAAIAGVVPASVAGGAAAIAALMLKLARILQGNLAFGPRQAKKSDGTAILLLVGASALGAAPARADAPSNKYGGCIVWSDVDHAECTLEAGVATAVMLGRYESGRFSAGFLPGIGYGLVLAPDHWYALGVAAYGSLLVGSTASSPAPDGASLSAVVSFANYLRFGIGETWLQQEVGPVKRGTAFLFGLGDNFGGGPEARRVFRARTALAQKDD